MRNPRLFIFDEATSALDSITEQEISAAVRDICVRKEQIVVLIAHRLSTIAHANTIYVLEKGRIVESGGHDDLLARKGLYYAMWRQQVGERDTRPRRRSSRCGDAGRHQRIVVSAHEDAACGLVAKPQAAEGFYAIAIYLRRRHITPPTIPDTARPKRNCARLGDGGEIDAPPDGIRRSDGQCCQTELGRSTNINQRHQFVGHGHRDCRSRSCQRFRRNAVQRYDASAIDHPGQRPDTEIVGRGDVPLLSPDAAAESPLRDPAIAHCGAIVGQVEGGGIREKIIILAC